MHFKVVIPRQKGNLAVKRYVLHKRMSILYLSWDSITVCSFRVSLIIQAIQLFKYFQTTGQQHELVHGPTLFLLSLTSAFPLLDEAKPMSPYL